jgi:predicted DNA-binding transcriptional regulator AlpA
MTNNASISIAKDSHIRATLAGETTPLLTEVQVAKLTGMSLASVRRWRLLRQGPRYLKIGAAVRYKPEDLAAWLESRPSGGEHQTEAR